jgi:hypothetical protein
VGLIEDVGAGPVGLDTVVFIYFIEEHPRYLSIVAPLFERVARGEANALAAALRGEIDVEGEPGLLMAFERLFPGPGGVTQSPPGRDPASR